MTGSSTKSPPSYSIKRPSTSSVPHATRSSARSVHCTEYQITAVLQANQCSSHPGCAYAGAGPDCALHTSAQEEHGWVRPHTPPATTATKKAQAEAVHLAGSLSQSLAGRAWSTRSLACPGSQRAWSLALIRAVQTTVCHKWVSPQGLETCTRLMCLACITAGVLHAMDTASMHQLHAHPHCCHRVWLHHG